MQPAENKDYSRDVILRLSPTRNTIIVEEQKPGGIAAYREIDPLELYYVINQSYASNDYLDSGFLPEHCLHLSMSATEKYFVLWNPELRADVIYGDREYPNFPIPRMVFGVRVLENGKVAECSMGVVADEAPTVDTPMFFYPFSNVHSNDRVCTGIWSWRMRARSTLCPNRHLPKHRNGSPAHWSSAMPCIRICWRI